VNAKPPSAFNAKTQRCQDTEGCACLFHTSNEFLRESNCDASPSFLAPLPLCAFALIAHDNSCAMTCLRHELKLHGKQAEFNNRVVNPTLQPLKGYWMVIHDSGRWNQVWQKLTWSNSLPAGCAMEVYVRASDDRLALANEPFVAVSNNVPFTGVNGRYIEVRLALVRSLSIILCQKGLRV